MRREIFRFSLCVFQLTALWLWHCGDAPTLAAAILEGLIFTVLMPGLMVEIVWLGLSGAVISRSTVIVISAAVWLFPFGRVRRLFGINDPFADKDRPRPVLSRCVVWILDQADKRFFGRQKSGGWAGPIRAIAAHYRAGDLFAGRMSLFGGQIGTLWPVGVKADGQAVTFGMQGSGKTAGAVINAALQHDGGLLAFDSVGEITDRCYARRGAGDPSQAIRGLGNETHVIDPTRLTMRPRSRYNALHEIAGETDPGKALRLMFALAEAMIKNPGGENSWVYEDARDFLYGLIAHVVSSYCHERQTLVTVRELLTEGDCATFGEAKAAAEAALKTGKPGPFPNIENMTAFDMLLDVMMKAPEGPFRHIIAGQAATVKQMGDRQRGSVLSATKTATIWLDMPDYRDAVTKCDFYLADFATKQLSVFVCVPLDELQGIASGFVRTFLTLFTTIMYKAPTRPKKTVLCLVDEFPQFGHIARFCVIGPTMRKYGVKLWVVAQDLEQMRTTYPKDFGTFLGCAAMVQFFNVHHDETVDYLVKSLGEGIVRLRDPDTGRMVKRPFPLLDRQQVPLFLSDGNCIVIRYHKRPYRLKAAMFYAYCPYWMYSPDPAFPEPPLRAWMRQRAVRKAQERSVGAKALEAVQP